MRKLKTARDVYILNDISESNDEEKIRRPRTHR